MTDFIGTSGNDTLTGTSGDDNFNLSQGGEDSVAASGGDDVISMANTLDAGDSLDGGAGFDTVLLRGNYARGLTLGATTLQNIERVALGSGFDYKLAMNDGDTAAGKVLVVSAANLGSGNSLVFDGSAETDGFFHIFGGAGRDLMTGGAQRDIFDMRLGGGTDTIGGNGGDDIVLAGANLDALDNIDGGAGHNVLRLDGDYSDGVNFALHTIRNIEAMQFGAGHDYNITLSAQALPNDRMLVRADHLAATDTLIFNGARAAGRLHIVSGDGTDTLTGGAGGDTIFGGLGADTMSGRGGNDVFAYTNDTQSDVNNTDHITDFDADADKFDFNFTVTAVVRATAVADTPAGISVGALGAHGAALIEVSGGLLAGRAFLAVDANGDAIFDTGDYLIDVTGIHHANDLGVANFV